MDDLLQHQQAGESRAYVEPEPAITQVAEPTLELMKPEQLRKAVDATRRQMQEAAHRLDFVEAAHLRDEMLRMMAALGDK